MDIKDKIILPYYKNKSGKTGVEIDLKFLSGLTLISGESGVGKTYFCRKIRDLAAERQDIQLVDYSTSKVMLNMILNKNVKDTIIIIDNGDVILTEEHRKFIKYDFNNQYIIFVRRYNGLYRGPKNVARMIRVGNIITLKYTFLQGMVN